MLRRPLLSTLFPYTTLFRSGVDFVVAVPVKALGDKMAARAFIQQMTGHHVDAAASCHQEIDIFHGAKAERVRSEEHTSELQSRGHLVCRLLLEKKKKTEENG